MRVGTLVGLLILVAVRRREDRKEQRAATRIGRDLAEYRIERDAAADHQGRLMFLCAAASAVAAVASLLVAIVVAVT